MDDNIEVAHASFLLMCSLIDKQKKKEKSYKARRWWMKTLYQKKNLYSGLNLLKDLSLFEDDGTFFNFTRMTVNDFEFLLERISPAIQKQNTSMREAISARERLAVTLRYLATGDSFSSLRYTFKFSKQAISVIVPEVCEAIIEVIRKYVKFPTTANEWLEVSENFNKLWNFPHCLGALDGKHVLLQAPFNSGSEFFNYKQQFSIVLFAFVDANYNFLYANVGCQGRISDSGVFKNTTLYKKISDQDLNTPAPARLQGRQLLSPYVFLSDEAFALLENLMRPYAGTHHKGSPLRIFNYRLSRARRVVENTFGIFSSIWRVLRQPVLLQPEKARIVVMCAVYLHNFLRSRKQPHPVHSMEIEALPSENLLPLRRVPIRPRSAAEEIRKEFTSYFSNEGQLSWQNDIA